jgi:mannose-6-phosphate isomerase-like protein (cupin superfamily)
MSTIERTTPAEPRWFIANLARIHVRGDEAGGLGLVEITGAPGDMPPLHVHHRDDEVFYVLEGELELHAGDTSVLLGPGEAFVAPRGVPHVYRVASPTPARWLGLSTAGFEAFVEAASDPAPRAELPPAGAPDLPRIMAAAAAADIELLAPPGTFPRDLA